MFEDYQQVKEETENKITIGMMVYFALGCASILLFLTLMDLAYDERPRSHVGSDILSAFMILIDLPFILFGGIMAIYTKYKKKGQVKWWLILTLFAAFPYFFGIIASFFPAVVDVLFK